MMCHLGVEDPRFADAPQPFRTHPDIPRHPFEKFGCTVCHQGQDMATTVKAAHGEVDLWESPPLRGPYHQPPVAPSTLMPPSAALPEEDLRALTIFMLSLRDAPPALVASTPLPASIRQSAARP